MTINVRGSGPADFPVARVTLNDEILEPEMFGAPVERDPGRYVVRVEGDEIVPQERAVDLRAGESTTVDLRVVHRDERPISARPGITGRKVDAPADPERVAAWTAIGVGGVGLLAAAASGAMYVSALDDLNRACPNRSCDPSQSSRSEVEEIQNRGRTAGAVFGTSLVVGALATATGIVLFAVNASHPTTTSLVVFPGGLAAIARF